MLSLELAAGLAGPCTCRCAESERPQPSEGVQLLGFHQRTRSTALLLAEGLAVPECLLTEACSSRTGAAHSVKNLYIADVKECRWFKCLFCDTAIAFHGEALLFKGAASSMHLRCTNPDMHSLVHPIYPSIRLHACNQRSTARGYTLPGSYFTSHSQAFANSGLLLWSGHLQLDLQGSPQRL